MNILLDDRPPVTAPLAPVIATMRAMFGTDDLSGLARGLLVEDEPGWLPATTLVAGPQLPHLLTAAGRRWRANPSAAAALGWKTYTYWLVLPAVLGWAAARRVPLLRPADVLIHFTDPRLLVTIGLHPRTTVAVLPNDPLAHSGLPGIQVVADEDALLAAVRGALLEEHLLPMIEAIRTQVRIGTRTLLGSVAASVGYILLRAAEALPGDAVREIAILLDTFGVADLIELAPGPDGAKTVQRRTCCLAFTLPEPKICAGCCLPTDARD